MHNVLKRTLLECPHCGHQLHAELDPSKGEQDYYQECPACNKDIHLNLHVDEYLQNLKLIVDSDEGEVS